LLRPRSLLAAAAALPEPVRGGLWIIVSTAFFTLTAVIIRHLSTELDSFEIAFFRYLFEFFLLASWPG
jgi:hypothetical protein